MRSYEMWGRRRPAAPFFATCLAIAAVLGVACGGDGDGARPYEPSSVDVPRPNDGTSASVAIGSRRITVHEYNQVLRDVLLDPIGFKTSRTEDTKTGYDNDIDGQPLASPTYIEETEAAATEAAARFVANPAAWAALVPCTATGAGDVACLRQFIGRVGRKLLRRTMASDELDRYVSALQPFAIEKNDFKVGAQLAVQALLQETEFLYLVRTTRPIQDRRDVVALSGTSRASALSFFLWGTTPDDPLLDKAEGGELDAPLRVAEVAAAMLEDPRSRPQLDRFVAMWFGYEKNPALTADLADEMNHVVERAVFTEDADLLALFTSNETYLPSDALADAYGLPHPGAGGGWVPYGASGRAGILSTGAVLTMGAKGGDTSPTQRGKAILEKLLCTPMQRPADVNVDQPPAAPDNSPCKVARYKAIGASGPQCAGCHRTLDGLGLGLESYDLHGRQRDHDDLNPSCAIPGDGELPGVGAFKGPGQLGSLLVQKGTLGACIVKQVFRYGLGREEQDADGISVSALTSQFNTDKRSLRKLLVALVSSNAFLTVQE
jgi:Protein of unknown function (DUF1588)/Protein of unknown function (DUF1592)/Protein of unknown function (DUF1585)/Protein of unknown function (DUF1595)